MRSWMLRRRRSGQAVVAALAIVLMVGCGRDRSNPLDPNFPGSESLSPPTNVAAAGGIGRIAVTWKAISSSNLAGYGVYRATSSTGSYARLPGEVSDSLITTGRTVYIDTTLDLSGNRIYFYRVNTVDVLGQSSELSVFASAEALEDSRPPAAPSDLSAVTDETTGLVTITWSAPQTDAGSQELTGLKGYRIFRAKDTQDAFVLVDSLSASQTSYTDNTPLELDARYYYRVSAIDGQGNESGRSASASITTTGTGVAAPSGLRTTGRIGEIEVAWNAVNEPSLLGYLLLRSTDTQQPFTPITSDTLFTTAQTTYVDEDVVANTVYFYRVQSVIQDSERGLVRSEASAFVDGKAEVDQTAPAAPADLLVSLDESTISLVTLGWTAPTTDSNGEDITGLSTFRIFRSRETATSYVLLAEVPATQVSYNDTDVEPLTRYFYAVSAVDPSGNVGARSASVSVTTRGLATPSNVRATAGPARIFLTWTANTEPELTGYQVLRYSDPSQAQPDSTISTVLTTLTDSLLVPGQTYIYRVMALGVGGIASELSNFVSAAPDEPEPELATPRSVAATGDVGQIRVSWSANTEPELTGYRVMRYLDASDTTPDATFTTLQTAYVDSPLAAGQTYVYRVQAVGSGGLESLLSAFASAQVPSDDRAPAAPGVVSATLASDSAIKLTWTKPKTDQGGQALSGLSRYDIYRSEGSGSAGYQLIASVDSTGLTYTNVGLETGTTYLYRIRSVDANGNESDFSTSVSVTTRTTGAVSSPTNVAAVWVSDESLVRITWSAPAAFTSFRVERQVAGSSSSDSFTNIGSGLTTTSFDDTNVSTGQTYIYRVLTRFGADFSDPSGVAVVVVP